MPHNFKLIGCVLAVGLCIGISPALATEGAAAVDRLVKTLTSQPEEKLTPQAEREADQFIDFDYIARYAMGNTHWAHLSGTKREEYVTAVRKALETRYFPRWRKLFGKGTLEQLGESHAIGGTFVNTALIVGKKKSLVVWHLQEDDKALKVVNLEVDGQDLLYRLRKRIQRVLERSGQERLIAMLNHMGDDE